MFKYKNFISFLNKTNNYEKKFTLIITYGIGCN